MIIIIICLILILFISIMMVKVETIDKLSYKASQYSLLGVKVKKPLDAILLAKKC